MFEITDSDGEVWINYKGGGRQWILAMMREEESQLLALLLERKNVATGTHFDEWCASCMAYKYERGCACHLNESERK